MMPYRSAYMSKCSSERVVLVDVGTIQSYEIVQLLNVVQCVQCTNLIIKLNVKRSA